MFVEFLWWGLNPLWSIPSLVSNTGVVMTVALHNTAYMYLVYEISEIYGVLLLVLVIASLWITTSSLILSSSKHSDLVSDEDSSSSTLWTILYKISHHKL